MSPNKGSILIIEDEHNLRQGLSDLLRRYGFEVFAVENYRKATDFLDRYSIDLILTDMKMKGVSELSLIKALLQKTPGIQIVVMTAYATVKEAVEAMKCGVYDYLTKPLDTDELLICLEKALERRRLLQELEELRGALQSRYKFSNLIGKSRKMQDIYLQIEKVAPTDTTVLIFGESGTGKELAARAIHAHSPRSIKRFVTLDCASIPEGLLASELFGYEKGAFTGADRRKIGKFEVANHGSLFIDEVSDIGLNIQYSLLRFLQDKEFERVGGNETIRADVRIIAATHEDLFKAVKGGKFREDLFYRLNVFPIYLPPLRERKEDIPVLAEHFLKKYNQKLKKEIKGLTTETTLLLMNYDWPGNIRELEHLIERAVIVTESNWIDSTHLLPFFEQNFAMKVKKPFSPTLNLSENIGRIEKFLISRALKEAQGNNTKAASMLGITYRALRYKMKKHDFD